jgi:hypothetical protein
MILRLLFASVMAMLVSAMAAQADPLPNGFVPYVINASQKPVTEDGITTFHIIPGDCSDLDYGDGRGESDCKNGNTKSVIQRSKDARIGQTFEYKFDFWVDPDFGYAGEYIRDSLPYREGGWDSRLRIASWEGPFIKNFVYMLKLDSTNGATFFGEVCQAPEAFGSWVTFSMKVHWANNEKGWVKVTCDDRIVFADEVVSTTAQTQCYEANECRPGLVRDPKSLNFLLGLALNGFGHDWKENGFPSAFPELPEEGLTLKMRNIAMIEGAEPYGPEEQAQVKALQEALNALDCPVGTPDGVVGPKTRQQALVCRGFPAGEMPLKLTVATVDDFVALYSRPGVADLGPGSPPVAPDAIYITETKDDTRSDDEAVHFFGSFVKRPGREVLPVDFLLIGPYDRTAGTFRELDLLLDQDIADAADSVAACLGNRIEDWGDAGKRLVLKLAHHGDNFEAVDFDCILKAVPEAAADKVAYLIDHFGAFAGAMVDEAVVAPITDADLRGFIGRVAKGEVVVGREAAVDSDSPIVGLLEPDFVVHAYEERSKTEATSPSFASRILATVEGRDFGDVDIFFNGYYVAAKGTAVGVTIDMGDELGELVDAISGKCRGTSVWHDPNGDHLRVNLGGSGTAYTMPSGECVAAALPGRLGEKAAFVLHHFSDIAVGMARDGRLDSVVNDGFRTFMTRVAMGEVTVSD